MFVLCRNLQCSLFTHVGAVAIALNSTTEHIDSVDNGINYIVGGRYVSKAMSFMQIIIVLLFGII